MIGLGHDRFGNPLFSEPLRRNRVINYFYADGRIKYECWNPRRGSVSTDTDWYIQKYTYDGNELYQSQILNGATNSEAVVNALDWDI